MKTSRFVILAMSLWFALAALPRPVLADRYDESQSHPLRATTYVLHPIGRVAEVLIARPFHFLVSSTRTAEWLFGHNPHPPLFNPRPITDVGYSRQYQPSSVSHGGGAYSSSSRWASRSGYGSGSAGSGDRGQRGSGAGTEEGEAGASGQQVVIKEVPVVRTVVKEVPQVVVKEVPTIVEVEKVVFPDVAFQFDSDKLTDLGKGKVYLAAQMLKDKSGVVVVIEGHADRIGTDEYNMALGLRRAETVKKELEGLGIGPDTVSVVSVGEARPLIDQDTDWARAVNRRVELRINPN